MSWSSVWFNHGQESNTASLIKQLITGNRLRIRRVSDPSRHSNCCRPWVRLDFWPWRCQMVSHCTLSLPTGGYTKAQILISVIHTVKEKREQRNATTLSYRVTFCQAASDPRSHYRGDLIFKWLLESISRFINRMFDLRYSNKFRMTIQYTRKVWSRKSSPKKFRNRNVCPPF